MIKHPLSPAQESTGERFPAGHESKSQLPAPNAAPALAHGVAPAAPATLTRRAAVGTLAAAVALSPCFAAATPVTADHPDRELIEMGRRYSALEVRKEAAAEHFNVCCDSCEWPDIPQALLHTREDRRFGLHLSLQRPIRLGEHYLTHEIEVLKHTPLPWDDNLVPLQQARLAEIVREHQRWLAECDAADEDAGIPAAQESLIAIETEQVELIETIEAAPAVSLVGLQVKASIVGCDTDAGCWEDMHHSIVRDILAMRA